MKWAFDALVLVFSVLLLAELALPPPPPLALTVASNVLLALFAVEVTRCRDREIHACTAIVGLAPHPRAPPSIPRPIMRALCCAYEWPSRVLLCCTKDRREDFLPRHGVLRSQPREASAMSGSVAQP